MACTVGELDIGSSAVGTMKRQTGLVLAVLGATFATGPITTSGEAEEDATS